MRINTLISLSYSIRGELNGLTHSYTPINSEAVDTLVNLKLLIDAKNVLMMRIPRKNFSKEIPLNTSKIIIKNNLLSQWAHNIQVLLKYRFCAG